MSAKNKADNTHRSRPATNTRLPFRAFRRRRTGRPRTALEPVQSLPGGFPWGFPITFPPPTSTLGADSAQLSHAAQSVVHSSPISSCSFSIFRLSNRDLSLRASLLLPPSSLFLPCRDSRLISGLISAPLVLLSPSPIRQSSCPYWLTSLRLRCPRPPPRRGRHDVLLSRLHVFLWTVSLGICAAQIHHKRSLRRPALRPIHLRSMLNIARPCCQPVSQAAPILFFWDLIPALERTFHGRTKTTTCHATY